jgi:hypothetical protein
MEPGSLAQAVRHILSPADLLKSPSLVCLIVNKNRIHVNQLMQVQALGQFHATCDDLWRLFQRRGTMNSVGQMDPDGYISLNFMINRNCLILEAKAKADELSQFVYGISGKSNYNIWKIYDGKWKIKFETEEDMMAFWRSLAYVPFQGGFLSGSVEKESRYKRLNGGNRPYKGRNRKEDPKVERVTLRDDEFPPLSVLG